MRVLFVISVIAVASLIWATMAAAQHIRRARRRRRGAPALALPPRQPITASFISGVALSEPHPRTRPLRAKQLQTHF